jgi:hypothetical protein
MDRRFKWITFSAAIAAIILFSQQTNGQLVDGGCGTGDCATGSAVYGDAGVGCDSCRTGAWGGSDGRIKSNVAHLCEYHRRVYRRNRVWPKPFDCADRQLYFAMWEPMFDSGFRCNCVFTDNHFDAETNELNDAGKAKIAGIFRNAPKGHKVALVQNAGDANDLDARLRHLESTIDTWYGTDSFSEIALTDKFLPGFSASRVETLMQLSGETTPPPVIPVASGTGSTSDVGVGE